MNIRKIILAAAIMAPMGLAAKVSLPPFFSDNMVLQHSSPVRFFGTAEAGADVSVKASWTRKTFKTTADEEGNWCVFLNTPAPGGPHTITVSDGGEPLTLGNILSGEVWLCGGQSNMEMSMRDKVIGGDEDIAAAASYKGIRLLRAVKSTSAHPQESIGFEGSGGWETCSSESLPPFSAAAFYFGKKLNEELGIPVGLIESCWGGTIIEAWTSAATLGRIGRYQETLDLLAALPKDREGMRKSFEENVAKWERRMAAVDPAFKDGVPVWGLPGADVSDWIEGTVPGFLQMQGIPGMHGFFWMRKDVEIPESWAGKDLVLKVGAVDDNDFTYFNGQWVGHTESCIRQSVYNIPGNLVKPGINTIAVRVEDTGGMSGILGGDDILRLCLSDDEYIPLSGKWLCKETISQGEAPVFPVNGEDGMNNPTGLFNAMIYPLRDICIRGVIWYQGESNSSDAEGYKVLMPAMIRDWRQTWGYDFPFYYAQIANYMDKQTGPERSEWAELREAQLESLAVEGTGMAVLIDIGEEKDIHPKNKVEVGRRLALNALANTYGKNIEFSGPVYSGYKIVKGGIRVGFTHAEGLSTADGKVVKGFYIAGPDRVFHKAEAVIEGNGVFVFCHEVDNPVSVRYAWANNPECNLVNGVGLPASPFRTDRWNDK